MSAQLPFDFDEPLNDLDRKTREWLDANPTVLPLFERFALQVGVQHRRFGIGQLTERVRWEIRATWDPDASGFKINNNYRAYIARALIRRHPWLADLIETRHVDGEEAE